MCRPDHDDGNDHDPTDEFDGERAYIDGPEPEYDEFPDDGPGADDDDSDDEAGSDPDGYDDTYEHLHPDDKREWDNPDIWDYQCPCEEPGPADYY